MARSPMLTLSYMVARVQPGIRADLHLSADGASSADGRALTDTGVRPIVAWGPIAAVAAIFASGGDTAVGWMPGMMGGGG